MKAKVNNAISRYEAERDRIKVGSNPTPAQRHRLKVIDEVLKVLQGLRS
jgi:hypothetical protein